jgi:hypothetical protein
MDITTEKQSLYPFMCRFRIPETISDFFKLIKENLSSCLSISSLEDSQFSVLDNNSNNYSSLAEYWLPIKDINMLLRISQPTKKVLINNQSEYLIKLRSFISDTK